MFCLEIFCLEMFCLECSQQVEDILKDTGIPTAEFQCDVTTYADIICTLLDIPVHKSRIQSLHVLFSLYSAFKHSQHFNQLARENNMDNMLDASQYLNLDTLFKEWNIQVGKLRRKFVWECTNFFYLFYRY